MLSLPNCAPTRRMFDMPAEAVCKRLVVSTSHSEEWQWDTRTMKQSPIVVIAVKRTGFAT